MFLTIGGMASFEAYPSPLKEYLSGIGGVANIGGIGGMVVWEVLIVYQVLLVQQVYGGIM